MILKLAEETRKMIDDRQDQEKDLIGSLTDSISPDPWTDCMFLKKMESAARNKFHGVPPLKEVFSAIKLLKISRIWKAEHVKLFFRNIKKISEF